MRKWYVIDDSTKTDGLILARVLKATTKEEAIREGRLYWEKYFARQKRHLVDDCYIGNADEIEDGVVDYDSITDIYSFKREEKPMSDEYILSHSPREIADENDADIIESYLKSMESIIDVESAFGDASPEDIADEIQSTETWKRILSEWYEDRDDAPSAEDVIKAVHLYSALAIAREEKE